MLQSWVQQCWCYHRQTCWLPWDWLLQKYHLHHDIQIPLGGAPELERQSICERGPEAGLGRAVITAEIIWSCVWSWHGWDLCRVGSLTELFSCATHVKYWMPFSLSSELGECKSFPFKPSLIVFFNCVGQPSQLKISTLTGISSNDSDRYILSNIYHSCNCLIPKSLYLILNASVQNMTKHNKQL